MATREITIDYQEEPTLLSKQLSLSQAHWELLAYVALIVINVLTHLWALGHMAMHHDESVHAWMSWKFFTGQGGFECGVPNGSRATYSSYCYNPVYHGPTLYLATYFSFFLFGISEATARLPMALAGIGLIASCWMLRPLLGRRAALLAALYMTISPSILYFTRFARHDALMLLWSFWLIVGIMRYLQERRARWLYLAAAALALAWATHELVFILLFILGLFVGLRLAAEKLTRASFQITAGATLLLLLPLMFGISPLITPSIGGIAMLIFIAIAIALLLNLRWAGEPVLSDAVDELFYERRQTLLIALGIFFATFAICFTVFFTYPLGLYDGLTAGLAYWLSQHGFRRGAQPWYYYLMQLPLYEPLILLLTLGGIGWWIRRRLVEGAPERELASDPAEEPAPAQESPAAELTAAAASHNGSPTEMPAERAESVPQLCIGFVLFWFILAFAGFSWAGEKMPWLLVHMTLPATLAGAVMLDRLLGNFGRPAFVREGGWQVAIATLFCLVALLSLFIQAADSHQAGGGIGRRVFAVILIVAAAYAIYLKGIRLGPATTARLIVLTFVALLSLYTVRATALAVYRHPDTPRELLVYTQTGPDVPLIAEQIEVIANNLTRNERSAEDPTGGHTMKVVMTTGDADGEGSLAWPFEWYLRDFKNIIRLNKEQLASATPQTFQDAPVLLLYKPDVVQQTRQALERAGYVEVADTIFNWWFPELDSGYKDRLYDPAFGCEQQPAGKDRGVYSCPFYGAASVLSWPLRPANWDALKNYLLFRELPPQARINGREMLVMMRCDVAPLPTSGCRGGSSSRAGTLKLVAEQQLAVDALVEPRALAVGPNGKLYVADGSANRLVIIDQNGELETIDRAGDAILNEPSGVAVDQRGNIYVSNTWLAQVDTFTADRQHRRAWGEGDTDFGSGRRATSTGGTAEGNQANPLGFFGPRGIAVDSEGNVYLADTGNKRIVVTDDEGNFRYQWGSGGAAPGQFNEPTSLAVGPDGKVYVADSWNGRVQVFERGANGQIAPEPIQVIDIPGWSANTYYDPAVAVGPNGMVAVTVPERHEVQLYNSAGELLLTWGGQGSDDASLDFPSGIAFDSDGLVYVAEKGNRRISVFEPPRVR